MCSDDGVSLAEVHFCRELRLNLANYRVGEFFPDSGAFYSLLLAIQFFVPEVLSPIHAEWTWEAIDGILWPRMQKTGHLDFEIKAILIVLSCQCLAPFHMQTQLAPDQDAISWLDLRLGQDDRGQLARIPYRQSAKFLYALSERGADPWHSHVSFGQRSQ